MAPKRKRQARAVAATETANESSSAQPTETDGHQISGRKPTQRRKTPSALDDLLENIRQIHPLCDYSLNPATHFRLLCREAPLSIKRATQLSASFADPSLCYLPRELIELCGEYVIETIEAMMANVVRLCQALSDIGGFECAVTSRPEVWKAISALPQSAGVFGPTDQRRVKDFIRSIDLRCLRYLRWFRLRQIVPAFIPLQHLELNGNCVWNKLTQDRCIVVMDFDTGGNAIYRFSWMSNWVPFGDIVPAVQQDLIGPCLNASTVTLTEIDAATNALNFRYPPRTHKDTLFHLLIGLAAIKVWIMTPLSFDRLQSPQATQKLCQTEWNSFNEKFRFGEPFVIPS
jgi:hypothetical protein